MKLFIACIIIALIGIMAFMMRRKLTVGGGCCGETDRPVRKVKVRDKDPAHYGHRYHLRIKGMHCGNCAATVENALNTVPGTFATVDLKGKQADVLTKEAREPEDFREVFAKLSYTLAAVEEVDM